MCGVPGANAWPEDADRILRDARRVFIGTDPDDTGRKAADRLAERIGARARILPWPEQLLARPAADGLQPKDIDWTALKVGYGLAWQDVAALMHESAGRRLLSMAEAGARLRTRPKDGGIRIGFSDIDSWLAPGLLPGQLMIPLAKTGTGKTVFLCNIAGDGRRRSGGPHDRPGPRRVLLADRRDVPAGIPRRGERDPPRGAARPQHRGVRRRQHLRVPATAAPPSRWSTCEATTTSPSWPWWGW